MRYFAFVLNTSAEKIEKNSKIRIKSYDYQSPVAAMNNYMFKNMKKGICYFAYREEENMVSAVFSYDERKGSFGEAYEYLLEMLNDIFGIKNVSVEPCEIVMYQFYEYFCEAKRREYIYGGTRMIEAANVRVYDFYKNEPISLHYDFKERIISENRKKENPMYDKSMIKELVNIESHKNTSELRENMVHYIISCRSTEAADDMTETLMQRLAEAGRLGGRRMEMISEIEPELYRTNNHLKEFIENNYGGVIVMDLSGKFGYEPVDYGMTCKYIADLVKKYRNDCLFVFTYHVENPGFAYQLLPLVQKHIIPVTLKEGKGSRRAALCYMKEQIDHIIAADVVEKKRKKCHGREYEAGTMHMIFGSNPGTAKTTVAKLFAGIAKEKGILKSGAFVERGGMDLDGLGCITKIREAFLAARGGVLFIDEAYSLKSDAAVTVLIQEMENRRDDVIVILAGYHERMQSFMEINEGLKSRIPYWIDFPDYNVDELTDIFKMMVKDRGFTVTEDAVKEARNIFEKAKFMDNFGNGRYVRSLIERAVQNQAIRLLAARGNADKIQKKELFLITGEDVNMLEEGLKTGRERGTARKELDEMTGLSSVKAVIYKAVNSFKLKKICMDKGIRRENPSLHMVFTGNPGTAKTTIARLFAEILRDEKVLSSGNFIEAGRADLVADHVGATAPLVRKKFKEAQGGVLFIDEAYSLCDGYENGFGDEAVNTLVQEMENHRDDVIVIFAGYSDQMQRFLDRNPGMASRIAFHVEFEDYSTDELCDITRLMLSKKQMTITDAAMAKLRNIYESARRNSSFGNGRFVRKMLEEAEMNLAERMALFDESQITKELVTTIEEGDIPEADAEKSRKKKQIGFCAA